MPELEVEDLKKIFVNPFYCINLDEGLFGEHEPIITKSKWVEIVAKSMLEDDDGNKLPADLVENSIKEWLLRLLDVLEGNYVTSE